MTIITGVTRGGGAWTPTFVIDLDQKKCIGCGRCYKVCPRQVFELIECEGNDDWALEDDNNMVMSISNPLDCIGCNACSKVCPKGCHRHEPMPLPS